MLLLPSIGDLLQTNKHTNIDSLKNTHRHTLTYTHTHIYMYSSGGTESRDPRNGTEQPSRITVRSPCSSRGSTCIKKDLIYPQAIYLLPAQLSQTLSATHTWQSNAHRGTCKKASHFRCDKCMCGVSSHMRVQNEYILNGQCL